MIRNDTFRPWGLLPLITQRLALSDFALVGSLSTEERSVAAFRYLTEHGLVADRKFYLLTDAASRFEAEVQAKLDARRAELDSLGLAASDIFVAPLLGLFGEVSDSLDEYLSTARSRSVLIDISGMPKRLFFHAIKTLLEPQSRFENVVVTYTEPHSYHEGTLAENPAPWHALPGFLAPRLDPDEQALLVGLGFEPLGLPDLYSSGHFATSQTHLLLPVTAAQQHVSRNWDFVRLLEPEAGALRSKIHRIDARNVPDTFDSICAMTNRGEVYAVLAPFGPKPVSLSMCLYACATRALGSPASVFYTQPSVYHPNYSSGVGYVGGEIATYGYCVRLNGQNLYSL